MSILEKIEVNDHIKKIITEEYGVSFNIENLALGISGLVKKEAKTLQKVYDGLNIPHKYGKIQTSAFEHPLTIDFNIIMFKNEQEFEILASQYNYSSSFDKDNFVIYLTIASVNGKYLVQGFTDSLQHELCHMYDFIHYKSKLLNNNDSLYHKVLNIINNYDKESKENKLATCIYLSFKTEQIAHANSFDAMVRYLKRNNLDNVRDLDEYKYLYLFHNVIIHFDEYENICKTIIHKSPEKILKLLKKSYSDYSRRIGRIILKNKLNNNFIQ